MIFCKKSCRRLDRKRNLYYNETVISRRCNSMAECPLPKPNTRVRFPSSAPIKIAAQRAVFFIGADDVRENSRTSREQNLNTALTNARVVREIRAGSAGGQHSGTSLSCPALSPMMRSLAQAASKTSTPHSQTRGLYAKFEPAVPAANARGRLYHVLLFPR